jgi:hypothetical protein
MIQSVSIQIIFAHVEEKKEHNELIHPIYFHTIHSHKRNPSMYFNKL